MRVDPLLGSTEGTLAQATGAAIQDALVVEKPLHCHRARTTRNTSSAARVLPNASPTARPLVLAHQPDEYVAIDDLWASTRVMALLALLCSVSLCRRYWRLVDCQTTLATATGRDGKRVPPRASSTTSRYLTSLTGRPPGAPPHLPPIRCSQCPRVRRSRTSITLAVARDPGSPAYGHRDHRRRCCTTSPKTAAYPCPNSQPLRPRVAPGRWRHQARQDAVLQR